MTQLELFPIDEDEFTPNWKPLEQHIGDQCGLWMWMYRKAGLEFYKNRETRRYLALDSDGNAYEALHPGAWTPVEFHAAYVRAIE